MSRCAREKATGTAKPTANPRTGKGNIRHKLSDILTLMILARLSGHTVRTDIISFGEFNLERLRKLGMLENGVPSEPAFCRVENGIDDRLMAEAMERFSDSFRGELTEKDAPDIICMDGKAMRGTVQDNGRNPDIVSAFSCDAGIFQDSIKRRHTKAARSLDTVQRIVHAVFSIWRGRRRKLADRAKGIAELKRHISFGFTRLMRFMSQK